jgi:hypothetical protein
MSSVMAYIDRYNLYHSLKEKGWKKFYWLNISKLLEIFLHENQTLVKVKYFTSPSVNPESHIRQTTYIEALTTQALYESIPFEVIFGRFEPKDAICNICNNFAFCRECGELLSFDHEKETDVNIAVHMLSDAYEGVFDIAFLITEDSDQVGTRKTIKKFFYDSKKVGIIYPPERDSKELNKYSDFHLHIRQSLLGQYQLPEKITKPGGYTLIRPQHWS